MSISCLSHSIWISFYGSLCPSYALSRLSLLLSVVSLAFLLPLLNSKIDRTFKRRAHRACNLVLMVSTRPSLFLYLFCLPLTLSLCHFPYSLLPSSVCISLSLTFTNAQVRYRLCRPQPPFSVPCSVSRFPFQSLSLLATHYTRRRMRRPVLSCQDVGFAVGGVLGGFFCDKFGIKLTALVGATLNFGGFLVVSMAIRGYWIPVSEKLPIYFAVSVAMFGISCTKRFHHSCCDSLFFFITSPQFAKGRAMRRRGYESNETRQLRR